ncbi:MAG: hypothetical protein KF817_12825 [Phycisphaeraceae bacterium]|nr:hypothetical protein [Phycisphaeraceae bacterium]
MKSMRLREFSPNGIASFRHLLADLRENPALDISERRMSLLTDPRQTSAVTPEIEALEQPFRTKREAAQYLHGLLAPIADRHLENNAGLWTWLTGFFFDSVCPVLDGKRVVRNDYHYVLEAGRFAYAYRHILCISWQIMQREPVFNRLLLDGNVYELTMIVDRAMRQAAATRIPAYFEVIDRLYWNPATKRPKSGCQTDRLPGNIQVRLPTRLAQLARTWDLAYLDAEHILDLLGPEFEAWRHGRPESATSRRRKQRPDVPAG